jgi:long-subunit fatty acid transport protein
MRRWASAISIGAFSGQAIAGGMYLPGSGAISTSRAGAAVASVGDGEAIALNPSGLSKTLLGTTITLSTAFIDYAMTFERRGTYDDVPNVDLPYEGQPYPVVEDGSDAALGIGQFQPIPVFAVTHGFAALSALRVALGLYAPNSYPFRNLCTRQPGGGCKQYTFNGDPNEAPNPARYDVVDREATLFMPTLAASYRILPNLDVGARFGWGFAKVKSSVHIWAAPGNVVEDVGGDGVLAVTAKDNFVASYGLGFTYRPTDTIEIGGNYNSEILIDAKGTAKSQLGPRAGASGIPVTVQPLPDDAALCAKGGKVGALKACLAAELPRSVQLGGRYKFLDATGKERGDIELNAGWENWGNEASTDFKVKIDSEIVTEGGGGVSIKENLVRHGFQNVYNVRLGGSWQLPLGENTLIARGGIGYDTAAAKPGWARADIDGGARTTGAVGAGYRTKRFQVDAGFGVVLDSAIDNAGECNPTSPLPSELGCNRDGVQDPPEDREGPDPINPIIVPDQQLQAPVNKGTFSSHYIMFMLGASTWF